MNSSGCQNQNLWFDFLQLMSWLKILAPCSCFMKRCFSVCQWIPFLLQSLIFNSLLVKHFISNEMFSWKFDSLLKEISKACSPCLSFVLIRLFTKWLIKNRSIYLVFDIATTLILYRVHYIWTFKQDHFWKKVKNKRYLLWLLINAINARLNS